MGDAVLYTIPPLVWTALPNYVTGGLRYSAIAPNRGYSVQEVGNEWSWDCGFANTFRAARFPTADETKVAAEIFHRTQVAALLSPVPQSDTVAALCVAVLAAPDDALPRGALFDKLSEHFDPPAVRPWQVWQVWRKERPTKGGDYYFREYEDTKIFFRCVLLGDRMKGFSTKMIGDWWVDELEDGEWCGPLPSPVEPVPSPPR